MPLATRRGWRSRRPFDGEGLFLIGNERFHRWITAPVDREETELTFDIGADWGPCAYVMGSVFRTETDASRERGPGRAIGLAHFCVSKTDRHLEVRFTKIGEVLPTGEKGI